MANLRIVTRNDQPQRTTDRAALVIVARRDHFQDAAPCWDGAETDQHITAFYARHPEAVREYSARAEITAEVNAISEEMRAVFQRFYSSADYPTYPWR